jgi:hypothetical protein
MGVIIRGTITDVRKSGFFSDLVRIHVSGVTAKGGDFFLKIGLLERCLREIFGANVNAPTKNLETVMFQLDKIENEIELLKKHKEAREKRGLLKSLEKQKKELEKKKRRLEKKGAFSIKALKGKSVHLNIGI